MSDEIIVRLKFAYGYYKCSVVNNGEKFVDLEFIDDKAKGTSYEHNIGMIFYAVDKSFIHPDDLYLLEKKDD